MNNERELVYGTYVLYNQRHKNDIIDPSLELGKAIRLEPASMNTPMKMAKARAALYAAIHDHI